MGKLLDKQEIQESAYSLPYHYRDLFSEEYQLLWSVEYLNCLREVIKKLRVVRGMTVLDLGCGDGRLEYELEGKGLKLTGVDYSQRALAFARAFAPGSKYICQKIENLDLRIKFNSVVLVEILEHIPQEKVDLVLAKVSELLKPGGRLIVTVPSMRKQLSKKHFQHFSVSSLEFLIQKHFQIIEIEGLESDQFMRRIYGLILKLGFLLYPWRYRVPMLMAGYKYIDKFYYNFLLKVEPKNGLRLLAVCTLRKQK